MRNLHSRLNKVEAFFKDRPCPVCSDIPRVVRVVGQAGRDAHVRRMAKLSERCTCARPARIRQKIIVLPAGDALVCA